MQTEYQKIVVGSFESVTLRDLQEFGRLGYEVEIDGDSHKVFVLKPKPKEDKLQIQETTMW